MKYSFAMQHRLTWNSFQILPFHPWSNVSSSWHGWTSANHCDCVWNMFYIAPLSYKVRTVLASRTWNSPMRPDCRFILLTCRAAFCWAAMCCCSAWSRKSLLIEGLEREMLKWKSWLLDYWTKGILISKKTKKRIYKGFIRLDWKIFIIVNWNLKLRCSYHLKIVHIYGYSVLILVYIEN